MQKGVARDIIAGALAELGDEGQDQMLVDLIEKKRLQTRYQDPDKLMQYLARQGFGYDQIKKALARLDD
jgi:SOS response regulatory protein OraA/RecX